jgi:hypothetical protein
MWFFSWYQSAFQASLRSACSADDPPCHPESSGAARPIAMDTGIESVYDLSVTLYCLSICNVYLTK